jgi:hypothetical protein
VLLMVTSSDLVVQVDLSHCAERPGNTRRNT